MSNVQLEYIDENLNRIIQNPDSVLYLRPYNVGNKRALFAMVKEEQGVYRKVQITKEQSKMTFPWEPIYWFYKEPGYFYLKDFIILNSNNLALNTTNLDGFKSQSLGEDKILNVGVFATFNDGSSTFVWRERSKKFEKKGGIQPYIDLLKKYKEYEPMHDTYKFIESVDEVDGLFVIPELQTKIEEQQMVKKLIPNTRKDD